MKPLMVANQRSIQINNFRSAWPSPWILPAHVVSNQQDKDRHPITKIAKCTIDTGNMQGNIVSRDFVENVLNFPSTNFLKLTNEEERGGTTISGDLHIPQGAIYLTWYHKSSTRVFRDMRFLISPAPNCDMIIGAQSIEEGKILSVPCLASKAGPTFARGTATRLDWIFAKLEEEVEETTGNHSKYKKLEQELEVVGWAQELRELVEGKKANLSKDDLWDNIIKNYSEISFELDDKLRPILVELRKGFREPDAKDPWINNDSPVKRWPSGIKYEEVCKIQKYY
jgi:hypothetical protein